MLTFDDLRAVARPSSGKAGSIDAKLEVHPSTHVGSLVDLLTQYFGEDDTRDAIKLVIGGDEIGFLHREDLYAMASSSQKGIGASDYGALPGMPNYRLIRLRCPVPGCPHRLLVTIFDEEDPPKCSIHPERSMEIES